MGVSEIAIQPPKVILMEKHANHQMVGLIQGKSRLIAIFLDRPFAEKSPCKQLGTPQKEMDPNPFMSISSFWNPKKKTYLCC